MTLRRMTEKMLKHKYIAKKVRFLSSLRGISEDILLGGLSLCQRYNIQTLQGNAIKIGSNKKARSI
jgi:hypothetical protein